MIDMTTWTFFAEFGEIRLRGRITQHPTLDIIPDKDVITSPVKTIDGMVVTTRSGTKYRLIREA